MKTFTRYSVIIALLIAVIVLLTVNLMGKDIEIRKLYPDELLRNEIEVVNINPVKSVRQTEKRDDVDRNDETRVDCSKFNGNGRAAANQDILSLHRDIARALIHVRGMKTRRYLKQASRTIVNVVKSLGLVTNPQFLHNVKEPTSVCPEVYKGTTFGYPFYYKGFETTNCTYASPLQNIITIVLNFLNTSNADKHILDVVQGIVKHDNGIPVKIAVSTNSKISMGDIPQNNLIEVVKMSPTDTVGQAWNKLVSSATTKYVLVGRDIMFFNEDARIERLVRELETLDVNIVGGAVRQSSGHWQLGCKQLAYRNFTLVIEEGYDESLHECVFCDHIDGPFLAETSFLQKEPFDEKLSSGLFDDYFLKQYVKHKQVAVCPDAMYFIKDRVMKPVIDDWLPFAKKWELYKIVWPSKESLVFPCKSLKSGAGKSRGIALHPCILEELSDMVKFLMKTCEDNDIICEYESGTLLGSVKFNKVLPWERDADISFLTANYSQLVKFQDNFNDHGYKFSGSEAFWCCVDNRTAGGKALMNSEHWHIELYGQHLMDSEILRSNGFNPTRLFFDGQWTGVPRNPGLFARNRYGPDIYKHAEHWMSLGKKDGWILYAPIEFSSCEKSNDHACLDKFNTDGNIQFNDPIP